MKYKLLSNVNTPQDIKGFTLDQLNVLCEELRQYLIETIPTIGGHFASSLGVVEISLALHYLYDSPTDKIIFDVGHQGYVHKILTGRKDALKTIRKYGGISGFQKREESPHDAFGAGHASTSISAALGMAKARDILGKDNKVIAVIGDGGMTGGLAYEGLNNAGECKTDLTVILNDNHMSISRNVGAMSRYLVNVVTNPYYQKMRAKIWELTGKMPKSDTIRSLAHKMEESLKTFIIPGMLFEDLGFTYYGPVDGHNLDEVIKILSKIKDLPGPKLVHFLTQKGKGCDYAEEDPVKYHGVKGGKIPASGAEPKKYAYTDVFGQTAIDIVEKNPNVCVVTPAMKEGSGLVEYAERFPDRFFDVGIAEGHALTFAAGLAAEGIKTIVAIYSTFLQRAFDHLYHDICIQKLPVVFAIDRAGVVGEDGPTHHGTIDLSYLNCIPDLIICAPKDGTELRDLLYTGVYYDEGSIAVRYPRDTVPEVDFDKPLKQIPIGTWEKLTEGGNVLILAVGSMVHPSLTASKMLEEKGIKADVVNARFIKPLDEKFLKENLGSYNAVFTIEENSLEGGFGSRIAAYFIENNLKTSNLQLFGIPDQFVTHGPRKKLLEILGLTPELISERIEASVKKGSGKLLKQLF